MKIQVDVGIGDAVTPQPEWLEYPSLLDQPRPRIRAYRPETSIAEKVHAMVVLGAVNSRLRDFFDIHALSMRRSFDGVVLTGALRTTFERRKTEMPTEPPLALTPAFCQVEGKRGQWDGFLRRNRPTAAPADLGAVIEGLALFIGPALAASTRGGTLEGTWPAGGPWSFST